MAATSTLNATQLLFTTDGTTIAARATASADTLTLVGASSASVKLSGLAAPTSTGDAATKEYVDSLLNGLSWKEPVVAGSSTNVTIASDLESGDTLDGVTLATNDRVLLFGQTTASENGVWVVQVTGPASRPTDFATGDDASSHAFFITSGTVNGDHGYVNTDATGSAVIDTDDLSFVQFNGAENIIAAAGLSKTGNSMAVNVDDSSIEISGDALQVKASGVTNSMLANPSLTVTAGSGLINGGSVALGATTTLDVNVDDSTIEIDTDALRIKDSGVTNAKLANPSLTVTAGSGLINGGSVALGGTTTLDVNVDDSTIEIDTDALRVKDSGITNAKLSNSSLTVTAGDGMQTGGSVSLGSSVTLDVDSTVVRTSGAQMIAGVKNFSDKPVFAVGMTDGTATMLAGDLSGLNTPTDSDTTNAATVAYVLSKTNSPVNFTPEAKVAPSTNVTISAPGAVLDGVSMTSGDRVLLRNQTVAGEDGLYEYNGLVSAMTRTAGEASSSSALNDVTYVNSGTLAGFSFIQQNTANYGSTLSYATFSGATPAGGSDTHLQFNDAGNFAGASNFTRPTSGHIRVADSAKIAFGDSDDLSISHDGTDNLITGITGNIKMENTDTTGKIIAKLGTASSATEFQVQCSAGSSKFSVNGNGTTTATGTMITAGHNQTIGTSSVSNTLTVQGIVTANDTTQSVTSGDGSLVCAGGVGIAKDVNCAGQINANTAVMTSSLTAGGDVSCNSTTTSTSSGTGSLVVAGGVGIAGDVHCAGNLNALQFLATSDVTMKTNIGPMSDPLAKIRQIDGYSYNWAHDAQGPMQYGVLAQEVEQVLPDIVATQENGQKAVNYTGLIAHLLEAVKTLDAKVQELSNN